MRFSPLHLPLPATGDGARIPGDRHAMARALELTLSAGVALVVCELAAWRHADLAGLAACIGAAALVTGVLVLRFETLHDTAFPLLLASGTMMSTAALGFAGNGAVTYPLFLIAVSVAAFRLLSRSDAHLQTGVACAAYAMTGASPALWALTAAGAWLAGLGIARLGEWRDARRPAPPAPVSLRPCDPAPAELQDIAA